MPRLAFVNKLDREGADPDGVVAQLRGKLRLTAAAIPLLNEAEHLGRNLIVRPVLAIPRVIA